MQGVAVGPGYPNSVLFLCHQPYLTCGFYISSRNGISDHYRKTDSILVAPKLRYGGAEHRLIYGKVAASFANVFHVQGNCQTPITDKDDPDNSGTTCISIEHAGQA